MTAKTNAERQKASDKRHRDLNRVGRKVWATTEEHDEIKALLVKLRSSVVKEIKTRAPRGALITIPLPSPPASTDHQPA